MNRMLKNILILMMVAATAATAFGCEKKEPVETTAATENTAAAESTTAEETMSPELKKAMEEGWIEEDWPEETKPQETKPEETKPQETKPQETKPEETKPQETKPQETKPEETKPQNTVTEYEEYLAMSPEEQQAFFESFDSVDAYFAWLNAAKAEYEEKQNASDLEGGSVDLSTMPK